MIHSYFPVKQSVPYLNNAIKGSIVQMFGRVVVLMAALLSMVHARGASGLDNDFFLSSTQLTGHSNIVVLNSEGATSEPDEPDHAGRPPAASLWWTWTAPDSGVAVVDTLGSSFDTVIGVYTGSTLGGLTLIAENDDAPGLASSFLVFPVVSGATYHMAVDGYAGATGDLHLSLRLPVAPTPPVIASQPANSTIHLGSGLVTFGVSVTGSMPLHFVWHKAGQPIPAATNRIFSIVNPTLSDNGDYHVVVSNPHGTITSSIATLTVLEQLEHDAFANAELLSGQTITAYAHNHGATMEAGEPAHAGIATEGSLWWSWIAPHNGLTTIDTSGSAQPSGETLDTVLAVYTGFDLNAITGIVSNNDDGSGVATTSKVVFRAIAGVAYHIAVAGVLDGNNHAGIGDITISLNQAPDNDFFALALEFPDDATTVHDHSAGATAELGEILHGGRASGNSVWWTWIAPSNGVYRLDTGGSMFDTLLGVYSGASLGSLLTIAEDDNRGSDGSSIVKFIAVGGERYYFAVDGLLASSNSAASGSIVLNLYPSVSFNDDFAERKTLAGQTNQVVSSNIEATKESGEPNHGGNRGGRSLWWTWTAPITGPVIVTTRNSSFDTTLAVYTGGEMDALTLIAENDDAGESNLGSVSALIFSAIAGQSYQIAVDGHGISDDQVAVGEAVLSLVQATPPELGGNDHFINRFSLTGQTNRVIGDNSNASKEPGEQDHAGNDGGRSLWWSWVAPASRPVNISTLGSNSDVVLAIYQGSSLKTLALVAADEGSAGGGRSSVTFEAVEGVEYQIAVDGFNDGEGAWHGKVALTILQYPEGALVANDDFEHATPISEHFLAVAGPNVGATREPGEPSHGGSSQGRSVWWTWTAQDESPVTISTIQSHFDTILSVYTGSELSALSLVMESDDMDAGNHQSSVIFQANAGTVYRIAVDGYASQMGLIILTVSPGINTSSAPVIQQEPASQVRYSNGAGGGEVVTFKVIATGSLPMNYQWFKDGALIEGATNDLLTLFPPRSDAAGIYKVAVSNAFGIVTSIDSSLTIYDLHFNDDFANRTVLAGTSNVAFGSISGATKEINEPHHGNENGGRSVWWSWVAPTNGIVEVHTLGSSFDTLLGVYLGNDVGNLTTVAENNDLVQGAVYSSRVIFKAVAGQEYQIAVDSHKTNSLPGFVSLAINLSPKPWIAIQPTTVNSVHITNEAFNLKVSAMGAESLKYQWFQNEALIPNATNAIHALESLSRSDSGTYFVVVTDEFGTVNSSNATVWVQAPQVLRVQKTSAEGRAQISFSDLDGTLSSEPGRFEVQFTNLSNDPETNWISATGEIVVMDGKFLFEDETSENVPLRFYRVIEK